MTLASRPLVVVVSLSTDCWGAEQSLLLLAEHLRADVQVVAPDGELLVRAQEAGLRTCPLQAPEVLRLNSIGALLQAARALRGLGLWHGDVAVSFSQWLHLPLALAGRLRRRPVALDLHDGPFTRIGGAVQSAAAWSATRCLAVSQTSLRQLGSWPAQRTTVVPRPVVLPPGVRAAHRERSGPGDPLRVVVVGRLDPEKRVDVVLEVQDRLAQAGTPVTLDVVGAAHTTAGRGTTKELTERWPRARFHGRLPYEQTLGVVAGSDLLVSMAEGEAFGRTVLEAALLGVPAAVAGGGPAERVRDGETGFLIPGGGAAGLEQVLRRLVAEPAAASRAGLRARAEAVIEAAPDRVAAAWLAGVLPAS